MIQDDVPHPVTSQAAAESGPTWSSGWDFILAATGAAVGLGNLWKFPYMAGAHGGSAFVLVYVVFVVLVGLPLMSTEMLLGKMGRLDTVQTLRRLAALSQASPRWSWLGWWSSATLLLVLSFYSVVAGWSLYYLGLMLSGGLPHGALALVNPRWDHFIHTPSWVVLCHTAFMIMTLGVVAKGVQSGLERASRAMMPGLLIILLVLVGYASSTPGFVPSLHFLFDFKVTDITPSVVIAALGHAFFTLAVGAGCLLAYGAYLPRRAPIGRAVVIISFCDVLVACLAGVAIFSLVFTYGLNPQGGPGLMFQVLPVAFVQMGGGQWFGGLFFLLLLFAAWTSSLSLAEPLVKLLGDRFGVARPKASLIVGGVAWLLGVASALSFNRWSGVTLWMGHGIFSTLTDAATNVMLPLGGLGFAWFTGWCLPARESFRAWQLTSARWFLVWHALVRYVVPVAIACVLVGAYWGAL